MSMLPHDVRPHGVGRNPETEHVLARTERRACTPLRQLAVTNPLLGEHILQVPPVVEFTPDTRTA
jgi:hypothetical protein